MLGDHGLDGLERPVDVVLDNVGGPQLVAAWELLAPGGSLQSIGWTSGEPAVFPPYSTIRPPKSISSFLNQGEAAEVWLIRGRDTPAGTSIPAESAAALAEISSRP